MRYVEPLPGHEFRGFVVRLYPDAETVTQLRALQEELRFAWNWLVRQVEDSLAATRAYAVREQLVPPRPERPNYDGMTPDEAKAARRAHRDACGTWAKAVYDATKKIPGCAPRKLKDWLEHFELKYDYHLITKVIGWRGEKSTCNAHLLQALVKNYFTKATRRKTFKRREDHVPLQSRSGSCFEVGDFGTRRDNPFYNCQVKINGIRIRGRLPGILPKGRVLEGVTITERADGWYAAVKVELPIRAQVQAVAGSVAGVDVGLKNLAAIVGNDGTATLVVSNRDRVFAAQIADRQAQGLDVGRIHLKASRHNLHVIYNEIIKPLGQYEVIKVEHLEARIGQMGSPMTSSMRTIYQLLKERYGDRVREVAPAYTSQDCSQCGFRSKESWSYEHGPFGTCPSCGYTEHRDINAARNIAAKPAMFETE